MSVGQVQHNEPIHEISLKAPPPKYDIIYMEKVWSHFCLVCVVLNLWNWFFFPPDVSGLVSVLFPRDNVCPPAPRAADHCG